MFRSLDDQSGAESQIKPPSVALPLPEEAAEALKIAQAAPSCGAYSAAMSQEKVEVVRQVFNAMAGGDQERARAYADPSIVVDATRRVFNPRTYRGFDGLDQLSADVEEVWEDFVSEPDEYLDAGDHVVVSGRVTGKGKASGVVVQDEFSSVWTVRDGRVVRWELHTDRAAALESLGPAREGRGA